MFEKILQPEKLFSLIRGSMARSLALIQLLMKLSNSPILYKMSLTKNSEKQGEDSFGKLDTFNDAMNLISSNALPEHVALSGTHVTLYVTIQC